MEPYHGLIHRYRDRLPLKADTKPVTLNEGNTPLILCENLPEKLNADLQIFLKFEGLNPTGSFKDRGMTVAITKAVNEDGARAVICASTGNTSAAAAAYAARAGVKAYVVIPEGKIALGKLAQALIHGAEVLQIEGNFDEGLALVKEIAAKTEIAIVNSVNPYRLQGQKTAAFEICEQLQRVPDYHLLPVGNAGNISAYWMGYDEYFQTGVTARRPKMLGFQAEGAAPFIHDHPIKDPETIATAIRIGDPQSWELAKKAQRESEGFFDSVSDQEILEAQQLLASTEGVFAEPASCASIAGLMKAFKAGRIPKGSTLVCTLTGHGLKDPNVAIEQTQDRIKRVPAEISAIEKFIT